MIPRVGQKIGPYEILGRLGSGGMGLVFSAWDARLHRDVAIKLLKDEYLNPTMRSRFLGEARAASRLNHPNICTIFDIGEEQDCPYMVMELLKGETLRGRMQQGSMPVEHILQVATQVADALSVAHEQGIVHRDIKPANVVLVDKPNGGFQTKVLDFGLAKVDLGEESRSGLTTTGMTVGTVSYMSPEQARGELLDGRSDLFSVGVLMYEMASGKLPFDGATSALIFVKLLNHPPEPLRNLNASMPRALEQVINGCLQKSRDDRYQTAQELVSALHKAAQTLTSSEKTASWLSKLASGLKRDSSATDLVEVEANETQPEVTPLLLSPDEAFLKPFRPQWKQGSSSVHYQPVNEPFDAQGSQPQEDGLRDLSAIASATGLSAVEAHESKSAKEKPSGSHVSSEVVVPRLEWLDEHEEAPPHDEPPLEVQEPLWSGPRIVVGSLLALAILVITVAVVLSKKHGFTARLPTTTTISLISNNTGDATLDSVIAAGLELALEQSPVIGLRDRAPGHDRDFNGVPHRGDAAFQTLQREAKVSGASTFSVVEAHMEGSAYVFALRVYDVEKGTEVGNCASTAASRERIVGAVDGLATSLRSVLGESGASIHGNSVPLSRSATGNIDALIAFRLGETSEASGHLLDAIVAFERAAQIEPRFAEVQLRLAELYNQQHAEISAAVAANRAQAVDGDDRTRMLAQGLQSYLASGDFKNAEIAFTGLTKKYPLNSDNFVRLAAAQLAQGELSASLSSSDQAVRLAPASTFALRQRMLALLALEQNDPVLQLAHARPETSQSRPAQLASFVSSPLATSPGAGLAAVTDDFDSEMAKAEILDASGRLNEGLAEWRAIALRTGDIPQLASSASFALSHAALDRALAGDCVTATNLENDAAAYPAGAEALFALGVSSGLCGNLEDVHAKLTALTSTYPQSFRVTAFYTSDLNAFVQWKSGAFSDALATLQSAKQYDSISFNSYLRGQVYLAQKQPQPATVEFQAMLRKPGALVTVSPEVLPMGYLALARAFVANGDVPNATQSYQRLATILQRADAADPILGEARLAASR